jgi:hypothetical protein
LRLPSSEGFPRPPSPPHLFVSSAQIIKTIFSAIKGNLKKNKDEKKGAKINK